MKQNLPSRDELNSIISIIDQQKKDEELQNISPQTLKHRISLANSDSYVHSIAPNGSNVTEDIVMPIVNLYSPSTQFGAVMDFLQGKQGYWESIHYGNSGILPDKFAANNPLTTMFINGLIDGGI